MKSSSGNAKWGKSISSWRETESDLDFLLKSVSCGLKFIRNSSFLLLQKTMKWQWLFRRTPKTLRFPAAFEQQPAETIWRIFQRYLSADHHRKIDEADFLFQVLEIFNAYTWNRPPQNRCHPITTNKFSTSISSYSEGDCFNLISWALNQSTFSNKVTAIMIANMQKKKKRRKHIRLRRAEKCITEFNALKNACLLPVVTAELWNRKRAVTFKWINQKKTFLFFRVF